MMMINECATAFAQIVCYGQYGRPYPSKQLGFLYMFELFLSYDIDIYQSTMKRRLPLAEGLI